VPYKSLIYHARKEPQEVWHGCCFSSGLGGVCAGIRFGRHQAGTYRAHGPGG